jgi:hypothetical protein
MKKDYLEQKKPLGDNSMKNTFLIILLAVIYIPFALVFSVLWGLIGGFIGTCLGTYEDWKKIVIGSYNQWRYLPRFSAQSWWTVNNSIDKSRFSSEKARILKNALVGKKNGPHPVTSFIIWTIYYFFLLIFRLIWGIFIGPVYACIDAADFFKENVLKTEIETEVANNDDDEEDYLTFERV